MREIPLTRGQVAIVDDSDYEWLSQWKWWCMRHVYKCGGFKCYAVRTDCSNKSRKHLYMHRTILGVTDSLVDHIDGDGLNNQRINLRKCNYSQNLMNQKPRSANRFKGTHFYKRTGQWTAHIRKDNKQISLGYFDNAIDAALAYNAAAKHLFGEYARLNPI